VLDWLALRRRLARRPVRTAMGREFHANGLGNSSFEEVIEIALVHDEVLV